jgi:phosphate uptake regulator
MLRELVSILSNRGEDNSLAAAFAEMTKRGANVAQRAGELFFGPRFETEEFKKLDSKDRKINKLQREIRKRILFHLAGKSNAPDLPYCLRLMSVVKDVERIGDYAKELAGAATLHGGAIAELAPTEQLKARAAEVEELLGKMAEIIASGEDDEAPELIRQGKELADNLEALSGTVALFECAPGPHAALVLATQYYARICGHTLNVLSSLVTPLHRLDYYDEKDFLESARAD